MPAVAHPPNRTQNYYCAGGRIPGAVKMACLLYTSAQLIAFLNDPKHSLTASGHTDPKPEAPEKEDTAHEEN